MVELFLLAAALSADNFAVSIGYGSSNTHQSSRRMNGIRCSWKPCKEKAISNICWMFFCTAQPKKRRLWLPSKEKR